MKILPKKMWLFLAGMIVGLCLLSFAFASFVEYPDVLPDEASASDIMPLTFNRFTNSWRASGTNLALAYDQIYGTYSLIVTQNGDAATQETGIFATVPLATSSGWTSTQSQSVTNNVSSMTSYLLGLYNQFNSGSGPLVYELISGLFSNSSSLYNNLVTDNTPTYYLDYTGKLVLGSKLSFSRFLIESLSGIGKDLMGSSGSVPFSYYDTNQTGISSGSASNLGELLAGFVYTYSKSAVLLSGESFLDSSGLSSVTSYNRSTSQLFSSGFLGLASILRGQSGSVISSTVWSFDEDLNKEETEVEFTNVLQALASIQSSIQQPLSQLQAVLANDADLKLRQDTFDQVDAIIDDFTGDGGSAPSVSDIGDLSSVSSGMTGMLDSGVGVNGFFNSVNSSDSYSFFSQAVANDLDTVSSVSSYSVEDPLSDYVADEDGFYSLADSSFFDIWSFLEKGG